MKKIKHKFHDFIINKKWGKPAVVTHTFNSITWEVETREFKFKAHLGYTVKHMPYLKKIRKE